MKTVYKRGLAFALLLLVIAYSVAFAGSRGTNASSSTIDLPFAAGEGWWVCQGYNGLPSHTGGDYYGLDIVATDKRGPDGCVTQSPDPSFGRTVLAPISGKVVWNTPSRGLFCAKTGNGLSMEIGHLAAVPPVGSNITQGKAVGTTAPPSDPINRGVSHIHISAYENDTCKGTKGTGAVPFDNADGTSLDGRYDLPDVGSRRNQYAGLHLTRVSSAGGGVAYVTDFGSGVNAPSFPGSSIFRNAITGGPIGSGDTGTYNGATFTNVPIATIDTHPSSALSGFDAVLLYQVCSIGAHPAAVQGINSFMDNGGKVMILDGDGCSTLHGGHGIADYSGFEFPFTTSSPGPAGATGFKYTSVEPSTLTAGLAAGVDFGGDAVGDSNVFTSNAGGWCKSIMTTNTLGATGDVQAYARTIGGGLAIYDGEDFWYTDGPTSHLKQVFDLVLAQAHNPDGLPCVNPASGIKLNLDTLAGTVGNSITIVASVVDNNGNPLDGVTVNFSIASGPDAGLTGSAITDPGQALFTFTNTKGVGTDVVAASFVDADGLIHHSNQSHVTWTEPAAPTATGGSHGILGSPRGGTSYAIPAIALAVLVVVVSSVGVAFVRPAMAGAGAGLVLPGGRWHRFSPRSHSLFVGREPRNDVVLSDEYVSRRHFRIRHAGNAYELEDLGSSSGTTVNGVRSSAIMLSDGDTIDVGRTRLTFRLRKPR